MLDLGPVVQDVPRGYYVSHFPLAVSQAGVKAAHWTIIPYSLINFNLTILHLLNHNPLFPVYNPKQVEVIPVLPQRVPLSLVITKKKYELVFRLVTRFIG